MPENNIGDGGFTDIFTSIERYKMFNYGDRVLYIGKETHTLKGLTGTVIEAVGGQNINLANIPVWWDSIGKHIGVFPKNVELIVSPEPDWEL